MVQPAAFEDGHVRSNKPDGQARASVLAAAGNEQWVQILDKLFRKLPRGGGGPMNTQEMAMLRAF